MSTAAAIAIADNDYVLGGRLEREGERGDGTKAAEGKSIIPSFVKTRQCDELPLGTTTLPPHPSVFNF